MRRVCLIRPDAKREIALISYLTSRVARRITESLWHMTTRNQRSCGGTQHKGDTLLTVIPVRINYIILMFQPHPYPDDWHVNRASAVCENSGKVMSHRKTGDGEQLCKTRIPKANLHNRDPGAGSAVTAS